MRGSFPFRLCLGAVLAALLSVVPALASRRAPQPAAQPKPTHPPSRPAVRPRVIQKQEHIQQWMESHSNLSLQEQLHALDNEPGFKLYPAWEQQQMRDQLVRLHNMPPQQRERLLERNEILEKMTAPQGQQYRSAVKDLATLPPDRQRLMVRAIKDLREMPPEQRESVINSDRFRAQFSDGERTTLTSLLAVEPYPPVKVTADGP
jgi:hypothetical protein